MDASDVKIEKIKNNLTPLEKHKLIIDNDSSKKMDLDFLVLNKEFDPKILSNWLKKMGLDLDQDKFRQLASPYESTQGLSHHLIDSKIIDINPYSHAAENLFLILTDLWEYWIPERPSMEKLEEYIWLGNEFLEKKENYKCCIAWLALFPRVWEIMNKRHQKKTKDPFEAFHVTFFNWIQELEMELWNLGLKYPFFHEQRIEIAEQYLQYCPDFDSHITESMRSALGETYFHIGKIDKANTLFEKWLQEDPTWGWGWINWSDCYSFGRSNPNLDFIKAEEILKKGLKQKKVRERKYILERLSSIYKETGRTNTKRISK